jgi:hypothetical protein
MEDREQFRRDLTRLLTNVGSHLNLPRSASAMVAEYIEHYEFGLAYELMVYELHGKEVPANAAESLKAAANMMGLEKGPAPMAWKKIVQRLGSAHPCCPACRNEHLNFLKNEFDESSPVECLKCGWKGVCTELSGNRVPDSN